MKREDFVFSVGYQGNSIIVDTRASRKYGAAGTKELAEKGLFRAALCSALYSGNPSEEQTVLEEYNRAGGTSFSSLDVIKRLVGVYGVPDDGIKVSRI